MSDLLDRYSRQMRCTGVGEDGQRRLLAARVAVCGCGALGSVAANALVRAGVGHVRLIDRDFVETNNLQRQVLFDEEDVRLNLPKAEAASRKLRLVNSSVKVEPIVADIHHGNILDFVGDVDLILDGADNFELRYLVNDAAVKLGKPWVYGGCLGCHGQTMAILPGETPCLRCLFEEAPGAGEVGTCETVGVMGPIVDVIASHQVMDGLKILLGHREQVSRDLVYIDLWENAYRRFRVGSSPARTECPCCGQRQFDWLEGKHGARTTSLCGRHAVQVAPHTRAQVDLVNLAKSLGAVADLVQNAYLLKFRADDCGFTVFRDGRAIIQGTDDPERARALYARYVGH